MPIDLNRTEEIFATSTDLTVGLEEEFALLDPLTLELVPQFETLRDAGLKDDVLAGSIAGELISSEIEIRSGRGEDLHHAIRLQREARARLFALAEARGIALGATGTHPWADYREQRNIDTEHYRRVVDGLQYVARRNNTFSLHVHVGVRDFDRAVRVCDRLRPVAPLLLAISANSPFLDARDSGLHSARTQVFTKSFPRCGVPDAYGSGEAYREYVDWLLRTDSIVEDTQIWWSLRPHLQLGTVEMRICDAQSTAGEAETLAGLVVAATLQAARDVDEGVPFEDPPRRVIEENVWRALRHGHDGQRSEPGGDTTPPAAEAWERLLTWTAPVRAEIGYDPEIDAGRPNGAQRQRAAIAAGATMQEVYVQTVRETRETYAREGSAA